MRLLLFLTLWLVQIPAQAQLQYRLHKKTVFQQYAGGPHPSTSTFYYYTGSHPTGRHESSVTDQYPFKKLTECVYDANDHLISDNTSSTVINLPPAPPKNESRNSYSYVNGQLAEAYHYDGNQVLKGKDVYTYVNNNLDVHTILTGSSLANSEQYKYTYDAGNKLTDQEYYKWDATNNNWKIESIKKFVYDSNNLLIRDTVIDMDVTVYDYDTVTSFYHYDVDGDLDTIRSMIWDTTSKDYIVYAKVVNRYDKNINRLIETDYGYIVHYPIVSAITSTSYVYETYWPSAIGSVTAPANSLTVYPVPARDLIFFSVKGKRPQSWQVDICSMSGRKMVSWDEPESVQLNKQVPLANFPAGAYVISVRGNDEVVSRSFIVEK